MFEWSQLLLFMTATLALNLTPGPDTLYTATRAMSQGKSAGIISALGIGAGTLVHIAAAACGLSAVLMYSATAFLVVKYLGAAYLIYLGIRTFFAPPPTLAGNSTSKEPPSRLFWQGVITNVLNPKVALFFISFLPQFTNPESGNLPLQITTLGILFNISGTLVLLLVATTVGSLGIKLTSLPAFWKYQRWFTGSVFFALVARLALTDRQ